MVKFHSASLMDQENSDDSDHTDPVPNGTGLLGKLVNSVRDSLGLELNPCSTISEDQYLDDTMSERTGTISSSVSILNNTFSIKVF